RSQAALDVILQTGPQVVTRKVHFAGRHQKAAVDQINDAVRQVAGKIWAIVIAAVLAQAPRYVNPGKALAQGELDVRISLVVAQKNVEAGLLLLDQVVL